MKKYKVTLTKDERENLENITRKGSHRSQKVLNALVLLGCDEGKFQDRRAKNEEIAGVLKVSMKKIDRAKKRFVEQGLEIALNGHKGERIYERKADVDFEAHLVLFARNTHFHNRVSIGQIKVTKGVADVLAMETMSAAPIEDQVGMALVVVARKGISAVRVGDQDVSIESKK